MTSSEVSDHDRAVITEQIGREPRGVAAIAARCVCGNPTVVTTLPRLDDGTPFPTVYYMTHPGAVAAASTLESRGVMYDMSERIKDDLALARRYGEAHQAYLADRARLGDVPEIAGISAGGMPDRVKCLHVLAAHSLASGPGVNPLGDEALAMMKEMWSPERCVCQPLGDDRH